MQHALRQTILPLTNPQLPRTKVIRFVDYDNDSTLFAFSKFLVKTKLSKYDTTSYCKRRRDSRITRWKISNDAKTRVGHWIGAVSHRGWSNLLRDFYDTTDPKDSVRRMKQSVMDSKRIASERFKEWRTRPHRKSAAAKEASRRKSAQRAPGKSGVVLETQVSEEVVPEVSSGGPREEPPLPDPVVDHGRPRSVKGILFRHPDIPFFTDELEEEDVATNSSQYRFYVDAMVDVALAIKANKTKMVWPEDFSSATIGHFQRVQPLSTDESYNPLIVCPQDMDRASTKAPLGIQVMTPWHEVIRYGSARLTCIIYNSSSSQSGISYEVPFTGGRRPANAGSASLAPLGSREDSVGIGQVSPNAEYHRHVPWCLKRKGLSLKPLLGFFRDRDYPFVLYDETGKALRVGQGLPWPPRPAGVFNERGINMLPCACSSDAINTYNTCKAKYSTSYDVGSWN